MFSADSSVHTSIFESIEPNLTGWLETHSSLEYTCSSILRCKQRRLSLTIAKPEHSNSALSDSFALPNSDSFGTWLLFHPSLRQASSELSHCTRTPILLNRCGAMCYVLLCVACFLPRSTEAKAWFVVVVVITWIA